MLAAGAFWNWLLALKFRHAKPRIIPVPEGGERPIEPVPFATRFPHVPIEGIAVADHVPPDEAQRAALMFCRLQSFLNRVLSPMQRGLPPVAGDARGALAAAYPNSHRRRIPPRSGLGSTTPASTSADSPSPARMRATSSTTTTPGCSCGT